MNNIHIRVSFNGGLRTGHKKCCMTFDPNLSGHNNTYIQDSPPGFGGSNSSIFLSKEKKMRCLP